MIRPRTRGRHRRAIGRLTVPAPCTKDADCQEPSRATCKRTCTRSTAACAGRDRRKRSSRQQRAHCKPASHKSFSHTSEFALVRSYAKSHTASRSVNATDPRIAVIRHDVAHIHGHCPRRRWHDSTLQSRNDVLSLCPQNETAGPRLAPHPPILPLTMGAKEIKASNAVPVPKVLLRLGAG